MTSETKEAIRILPRKLIAFILHYMDYLASLLINLRVGPNALSLMALLAGLGAGLLFIYELPLLAGLTILLCGVFDILDGKVAVNARRKSLFGAIFDSSMDRYSEFFIYIGIAYHFRTHWAIWIVFWALLGSSMVSYTRARAEGLGIECRVGIMQRAERLVLLASGAVLGSLFRVFDPAMIAVLTIIAAVSNITAFQRIFYVRKVEKEKLSGKEV